MKIVITGANGFIGTELINEFLSCQDVDIVALTRERKNTLIESKRIVWGETDYSIDSLERFFDGADAVIHLAAVRGTAGSIVNYQINECLTENVLLAMNRAKIKEIIYASSIAVYSDVETIPWVESDVLNPKTLYGISKATCEHLCMYYARKFGLQYVIFRIAQVLGEGESKPGMMNTFIDQAHRKEPIKVIGKSIAKRQFIYVRDLTKMIRSATLQRFDKSQTLNIGMDQAYSNLEIAQIVNRVFENDKPIIYQNDHTENIEPSFMNVSRVKEILLVQPRDMYTSLNDIKERLL